MLTNTELQQVARSKIDWGQVLKIASSIKGRSCAVSEGEEFSGGCNIVRRIVFDDGSSWALRVPYDETRSPVEPTVTMMHYVRLTVPSIPVAAVHAWSDSEDGDGVGTPYILLDWMDGRTLEWDVDVPPPSARERVLTQLVQFSVDLLERTTMHCSSSGSRSAQAWMLRRIDSRLARIFIGELAAFDPIDCLIYRAMAKNVYFNSSLDGFPFPLMHTDLGRLNILVDDNFNITGILDWDDAWVQRRPLQFCINFPAMISVSTGPSHSELFHKDRLVFMEQLASAVRSSDLPEKVVGCLPSIMGDDELQLFQSSIGSKGIYAQWLSKYAVRSARWVSAAVEALDDSVLARPSMASSSGVLTVRARLLELMTG